MRSILLLITISTIVLFINTCSSSNTGLEKIPIRTPQIETITPPGKPLVNNTVVDFMVTWKYGRDPFTVTWDFGNGGTPHVTTAGSFNRTNTTSVSMVNTTAAPITYNGKVTVRDNMGDESVKTFVFTVQPSP